MPVWHVSVSVWPPDGRGHRNEPLLAQREAVADLRGVGGTCEWWIWTPARVGHLRVPLTVEEFAMLTEPDRLAVADAGDSGPQRRRSR